MARATGENGLPLPRSLATVRAVRREAVSLYRQAKGGLIDAQMAGRLAMILQLLATLSRDHDFEERLERLEAVATREGARHRTNGRGHAAHF